LNEHFAGDGAIVFAQACKLGCEGIALPLRRLRAMGQGQQSGGAGSAASTSVFHLWIRKGLRWAVLAQAALSNFVTCSQAKNREVEAADHAITWPPPPARRRERETLPRRADLQCLSYVAMGALPRADEWQFAPL
jgi:hypothetical protein